MQHEWQLPGSKINGIKQLVMDYEDHDIVKCRRKRNLCLDKKLVTKDEFWEKMVIAINTTQNRSGPGSGVYNLSHANPFPLSLARCAKAGDDLYGFVVDELSHYELWLVQKNASWIEANFRRINENWCKIAAKLEKLRVQQDRATERKVARFLQFRQGGFRGLGPKQSRNVLQIVGLTRFEIPLDSRWVKWLKKNGFPPVSEKELAGEKNYCRVLDQVQELCEVIRVYPCILDAVIFASHDECCKTKGGIERF